MSSRQTRPSPAAKVTTPARSNRFSFIKRPKLVIGILIALIFAVALFIRVVLPFDDVFTAQGIKYTSNDSYSFMRLVDNLVHNFPKHMEADPYLIYPEYAGRVSLNFFIWLLAIPAWILGLGSPSERLIDVVGVLMPAILGALTVIPVYFIGKTVFGRWAGLIPAALIAILPGEFLGRSILGFTDNHVAEALFTTITILFLILAVKAASQHDERGISFDDVKRRDWASLKKPLVYSLLAAFFLFLYVSTWLGALLFVFIAFIFFVVQFVLDHLKRRSTDYLCIVGVVFFGATLLLTLIFSYRMLYHAASGTAILELISLMIATLAVVALNGISRFLTHKKAKVQYYPLALLAIAVLGVGVLYLVSPSFFAAIVGAFKIFKPTGASLTTIEMQPLISRLYGNNPWVIAWGNFNVSFFISFLGLAALVYFAVKRGKPENSLLVIWSLVILLATLGQRRFGYYLAVNVALLTGYVCWKFIELGYGWLKSESVGAAGRASRRARQEKTVSVAANYFIAIVLAVIVFAGVFAPNILYPSYKGSATYVVASNTPYAPSDAWVSSLNWLRENSPEPFDNPDAYYQAFPAVPAGQSFDFPDSAYGVVSWWDYGYWITRIARRIPSANPSQDPQAIKNVAAFFTAQDEASGNEILDKLNAPYIVIDHETSLSKFWAIVTWAGKEPYFDSYIVQQQDQSTGKTEFKQVMLYYPAYYRSMAVRLWNFDGKAVTPENVLAISYQDSKDNNGNPYKLVTAAQQFATFDEAMSYVAGQTTGNWKIVGGDPFKSPVPLDELKQYKVAHNSEQPLTLGDGRSIPSLKIFEYMK